MEKTLELSSVSGSLTLVLLSCWGSNIKAETLMVLEYTSILYEYGTEGPGLTGMEYRTVGLLQVCVDLHGQA